MLEFNGRLIFSHSLYLTSFPMGVERSCSKYLIGWGVSYFVVLVELLALTTPTQTYRFSVGTLGRSIFTRSQLGELFRESYKELPVHVGTLTNLGNFKGLYLDDNKLNLRKIRKITTFRAFRVGKVAGKVSVWVKRFMHSDAWLGLTATGGAQVDANPHRLFRFAAPTFDNVPPFELKTVDPTVIALIEKRYIATRPRLEAAYGLGKGRAHV